MTIAQYQVNFQFKGGRKIHEKTCFIVVSTNYSYQTWMRGHQIKMPNYQIILILTITKISGKKNATKIIHTKYIQYIVLHSSVECLKNYIFILNSVKKNAPQFTQTTQINSYTVSTTAGRVPPPPFTDTWPLGYTSTPIFHVFLYTS